MALGFTQKIYILDGKDYTFNGKGEFTLMRSKRYDYQLQARFEQLPNATCNIFFLIFLRLLYLENKIDYFYYKRLFVQL
jgi:hypothetical protein